MLSTAAILLAASMVWGEATQPAPSYEYLKSFDALIGCWEMEGPSLEDVPGIAKKGDNEVVHLSYGWVVKKNAIESRATIKYVNGQALEFLTIYGWDGAKDRIVGAGVSSLGIIGLSEVAVGDDGKTWTFKVQDINPDGTHATSTLVMTLTDPDTLVWQAKERQGGLISGESPKYILKRCKEKHAEAK